MKKLILISTIFLSLNSYSQDSILTKILSVNTKNDTTYYRVKVYGMGKELSQVWIVCPCKDRKKREKGELVWIKREDFILEPVKK